MPRGAEENSQCRIAELCTSYAGVLLPNNSDFESAGALLWPLPSNSDVESGLSGSSHSSSSFICMTDCFYSGEHGCTCLRSEDGELVALNDLKKYIAVCGNDSKSLFVRGKDGKVLCVTDVSTRTVSVKDLVVLRTASASLIVTHGHDIKTRSGVQKAGQLRAGDEVECGSGLSELIQVNPFTATVNPEADFAEVFEVFVQPKEPVEAVFVPKGGIWSYGHSPKTRRSGKGHRGHRSTKNRGASEGSFVETASCASFDASWD